MAQSATRNKSQTYSNDIFDEDDFDTANGGYALIGDAAFLGGAEVGGNDIFYGEDYTDNNIAYGDATDMTGTARGGADVFYGGVWTQNVFIGDGEDMSDSTLGGADTLNGGTNGDNTLSGDAYAMYNSAKGGNDILIGGAAVAQVIDTVEDYVEEGDAYNWIVGDAYVMTGTTQGGQDQITGGSVFGIEEFNGSSSSGSDVVNFLMGDAYYMVEGAIGNADRMTGGSAIGEEAYAINLMAGDAYAMDDGTRGGNDQMVGGSANSGVSGSGDAYVYNLMAGDTFYQELGSSVAFGSDTMRGGSGAQGTDSYAINLMFGDVGTEDGYGGPDVLGSLAIPDLGVAGPGGTGYMSTSKGGNDTMFGGQNYAYNIVFGDAYGLVNGAVGGSDVITGGGYDSYNLLVGDAYYMDAGTRGGNDRLVSGAGEDCMVGDALYDVSGMGGADTFAFASANGSDVILDFSVIEGDKIDFKAFKRLDIDFSSVAKLLASGRISVVGDDVIIDTDLGGQSGNDIVIVGGALGGPVDGSWFII